LTKNKKGTPADRQVFVKSVIVIQILSTAKKLVRALRRAVIMQDIQNQGISQRTKILIEKLLLGRFPLAEIAKVTGISEQLLQNHLNANSTFEP
jgi:hypothetical protein